MKQSFCLDLEEIRAAAQSWKAAGMRAAGKLEMVQFMRRTELLKFYDCFVYHPKRGWCVFENWREILERL